jgi:hypothetical protein
VAQPSEFGVNADPKAIKPHIVRIMAAIRSSNEGTMCALNLSAFLATLGYVDGACVRLNEILQQAGLIMKVGQRAGTGGAWHWYIDRERAIEELPDEFIEAAWRRALKAHRQGADGSRFTKRIEALSGEIIKLREQIANMGKPTAAALLSSEVTKLLPAKTVEDIKSLLETLDHKVKELEDEAALLKSDLATERCSTTELEGMNNVLQALQQEAEDTIARLRTEIAELQSRLELAQSVDTTELVSVLGDLSAKYATTKK